MNVEAFAGLLGADFYTGVPDSQLRGLCDYLMDVYGTNPRHHVIAANEGNCVALAAGYHGAGSRAFRTSLSTNIRGASPCAS